MSAKVVFLLDAGTLAAPNRRPAPLALASPPTHSLDTVQRLGACYKAVLERRPDARALVFVEQAGYDHLSAAWARGDLSAVDISACQCVPFGSRVVTLMLAFAKNRAKDDCEVVVISNDIDVVLEAGVAGTQWRHVGFMFIEDELVLPEIGLSATSGRPASLPAQTSPTTSAPLQTSAPEATPSVQALSVQQKIRLSPPVQRTIVKAGSAKSTGRSQQKASQLHSSQKSQGLAIPDAEDERETLRDSQLDIDELDGEPTDATDEWALADTVVDVPARAQSSAFGQRFLGDLNMAFADTMVDVEPATLVQGEDLSEADDGTQLQPSLGTQLQEDVGMRGGDAEGHSTELSPGGQGVSAVQEANVSAQEEPSAMEIDAAEPSRGEEAHRESPTSVPPAPHEDSPVWAAASPTQPEDPSASLSQAVPAVSGEPPESVEPVLLPTQEMHQDGKQASPERLATPTADAEAGPSAAGGLELDELWSASVLVGAWVRDGGKHHDVVPGPEENSLLFRQSTESEGLPILRSGGTWVLNGFELDTEQSTNQELRWVKPSNGASRCWQRVAVDARGVVV
eukprot:gnl/TRDRNA2_/TRDRNA2_138616_c0_seq1.p1 gnl/TRDRNA2_/TRDRNA2_138616_c0~~gnl/TRDRNA2_/TRDRNA2_138616_c0_seq1.p1  ORF type:complete len:569 (-),score=135.04 gnl/TRDRNA2_/TRDRNA2_138616_c0_seq1:291-1997(-)